MYSLKTFATGIAWGEGLRWYGENLWFSDIYGKKVMKADIAGNVTEIADIPQMPSGLGFLPDGELLIVSGGDKCVMKFVEGRLVEYADLSSEAVGINDMVVDRKGNVYVGCYGFPIEKYQGGPANGWITLVTADRKIYHRAGTGMMSPNGMVITPDDRTLIAADTFAGQLVAFDRDEDGILYNRRIWAELPSGPDGICIDAEGAVWAAIPGKGIVARICEGGFITDVIKCTDTPLCCMLGGDDRKTLFIVTVPVHNELNTEDLSNPEKATMQKGSVITRTTVEIPGAGWP